ncbi:hypothetical protein Gogos_021155 [Gossypium gossypioides]|uniref:Uncharacterized protein n=1 Tax=Gossypium gossypioides TaxID=34282 RepID=A0A7J9D0C8_GOSGO|nr:hypothetical protein [Gossypium gossypioides]
MDTAVVAATNGAGGSGWPPGFYPVHWFLEMAELCFSNGIMIMFVAVVLSLTTSASAQDSAMAPAPSMDTGAAFSPVVSGVAVMFSLIISLVALLKH